MSIMDDYKQLQAFDRLKDAFKSVEKESTKKYKDALIEIRKELCYGRTFYEGYFDSENLSRTDKVIKKINEALNDTQDN